ncbi:MAG: sortase [Armatimonadetes bacterium]|nr:sortase [Armatimonadota bacterium]
MPRSTSQALLFYVLASSFAGASTLAQTSPTPAPRLVPSTPKAAATTDKFRLIVPEIGLDVPVMPDHTDASLRRGPGYDPMSARPGQTGNCVIASHRNVHGAHFWYLPKLKVGSLVTLQTPREFLDYKVDFVGVVPETRLDLLENPPQKEAASRLMLYTCTLPVSINRFVVTAKLLARRPASPPEMQRPAVVPEIVSGPISLIKDPVLRARAQARLKAIQKRSSPANRSDDGATVAAPTSAG